MNFSLIVHRLLEDTGSSVARFAPELMVCATIILLLFFRLLGIDRWVRNHYVALAGTLVALVVAALQYYDFLESPPVDPEFFTGLLMYDGLTIFFRGFLLLFTLLVILLTMISGIPDNEDGPDFYTLLLGSIVGMMLMVSANHLLILFLGVEMASVPSYAMVGFLKGRKKSSEAALKFVVYGAGAAGVMLYGISLLTGLLGTASMPELAARLSVLAHGGTGIGDPTIRTVVLAIVMIFVGFAFKLSVVPFHFWCPDAFEGAAAEVAGFLSVASKAAAFALLVRVCLALVGDGTTGLSDVYLALGIGIGVIAAVTATFGNLAAYAQTNIKRLLAYSTIAHAGYMLMAVSALMVILNGPRSPLIDVQTEASRCMEGLMYYLAVYLFMNLTAFAVVALVRNEIYSEEIRDYEGLAQVAPVLCVCMAIALFSLVGIPPTGGFFPKLVIFSSLLQAAKIHWFMWVILVVGGLNAVFSLFYYARILMAMYFSPRPEGARETDIRSNAAPSLYVLFLSIWILVLGTFIEPLSQTVRSVAGDLLPQSQTVQFTEAWPKSNITKQ